MKFICPNFNNPNVVSEFNQIKNIFGEDGAYLIWHRNNGHFLDKAPNGKTSKLWQDLKDNFPKENPIELKGKLYLQDFLDWFGDWTSDNKDSSKIIDDNGEPKMVFHGSPSYGFSKFSKEKLGSLTNATSAKKGFFFASNKKASIEYLKIDLVRELSNDFFFDFNVSDSGFTDADIAAERYFEAEYEKYIEKQREILENEIFAFINAVELGIANESELNQKLQEYQKEFRRKENIEKLSAKTILKKYYDKLSDFFDKDEYGRPMAQGKFISKLSYNELEKEVVGRLKFYFDEDVTEDLNIQNKAFEDLVYSIFLNIRNPKEVNYKGEKKRIRSYTEYIDEAVLNNNDGLIIENTYDPIKTDIFVVFEPEQIKILNDVLPNFSVLKSEISISERIRQGEILRKECKGE